MRCFVAWGWCQFFILWVNFFCYHIIAFIWTLDALDGVCVFMYVTLFNFKNVCSIVPVCYKVWPVFDPITQYCALTTHSLLEGCKMALEFRVRLSAFRTVYDTQAFRRPFRDPDTHLLPLEFSSTSEKQTYLSRLADSFLWIS